MKSTQRISEGFTNSILIPAVILLFCGAVVCVFQLISGLILIALALLLFTTTTGFEINISQKQYRSYKRLLGISWGLWKSLADVNQAEIWLSSESATVRTMLPIRYPQAVDKTLKSITYDLFFVGPDGTKNCVFEFLSYKKALTALRIIENGSTISIRDRVAEKLAENQLKRQHRR